MAGGTHGVSLDEGWSAESRMCAVWRYVERLARPGARKGTAGREFERSSQSRAYLAVYLFLTVPSPASGLLFRLAAYPGLRHAFRVPCPGLRPTAPYGAPETGFGEVSPPAGVVQRARLRPTASLTEAQNSGSWIPLRRGSNAQRRSGGGFLVSGVWFGRGRVLAGLLTLWRVVRRAGGGRCGRGCSACRARRCGRR